MRHYTVALAVQFSAYPGVSPCFDGPQQHLVSVALQMVKNTHIYHDTIPPPLALLYTNETGTGTALLHHYNVETE